MRFCARLEINLPKYISGRKISRTKVLSIYIYIYRSRKQRLTALGIRCADHATPSIRKSWH
jgi:hypothetical protein